MALKTGRAYGNADVTIEHSRCVLCGRCIAVCKGNPLYVDQGRVRVDQSRMFGCVACGHCMAVCPNGCISVNGRDLSPDDVLDLPPHEERAGYDALRGLMLARRSLREFADAEVERPLVDKILEALSTAPMGLPPSDVEVLVLHGRQRVREFVADTISEVRRQKWMFSKGMGIAMRPFMGRDGYEMWQTFVVPLADLLVTEHEQGTDWLLYDAPLALYFHVSPLADPADPLISATYAMLAAESLGLGTCMIGSVPWFVKYSKTLKRKYGIPPRNRQGIMLIAGHPAVTYSRALRRRLAKVDYRVTTSVLGGAE